MKTLAQGWTVLRCKKVGGFGVQNDNTQLWRYGPVIMKLPKKNGMPPTFEVFQILAKEGNTARAASAMLLVGKEIAKELGRNSYNQEEPPNGWFVQREAPPRKIRAIKPLIFDQVAG